ncbi:MAG: DinB family protein [Acidobacteriota bacterium]
MRVGGRAVWGLVCAALVLANLRPAAQSVSLQQDLLDDWTSQKTSLTKISEAMPAEKYGFKSTPAQRNFGEQVLHIAEANVVQMGRLGAKSPAPVINMKETARGAILQALADSFDYGTAVIKEQTDQTLLLPAGPSRFSFFGPSTRTRVAYYVMGHTWDIYGQMVVYLRLNGIVPPASQRP